MCSISIGKLQEATLASIFSVVVSFVFYYFFTRWWGVEGTAYGLVVSSFVLFLHYYLLTMRGLRQRFLSLFCLVAFIFLFVLLVGSLTGTLLWNIFLFVLALLFYVGFLFLFGFVEKKEFLFAWHKAVGFLRSFKT